MATYQTEAVVLLYTLFFGEEEEEALPLVVRPKSVTWRRNSDRSADEAVIEVDSRAFAGLDPRAIYSMRVEVYVHDVRNRPGYHLASDPLARRFVGFVDTPEFNRTTDTDTLRLTCRDYTCLFIDRQMPKDYVRPVAGGQSKFVATEWSLDLTFYDFVQRIIASMEGEGDRYRDAPPGAGLNPGQVAAAVATAGPAVGGARAGVEHLDPGAFRRRLWVEPDVANINLKEQFERDNLSDVVNMDGTLWDVLSQVSDLLGVVPTIELDWLWIKRPSDYHGGLYHFKWGKNIADLQLRKELTNGVSRKVFEVRALRSTMAPGQPRVVFGVWPQTTLTKVHAPVQAAGGASAPLDDPSNAARGGSAKGTQNQVIEDVVVRFLLDGDYTEEQLTKIARTFYEEAARQDLQGYLVTHECVDLGFTSADTPGLRDLLGNDDGPKFLQWVTDELMSEAIQGLPEAPPRDWQDIDDDLSAEVEVTTVADRPPSDLMTIRNSSIIVLDLPPAPVATDAYVRQAGGVVGDPGFLARLSQRAARVAAENATTVLYVKEAEHTWNIHDGYTVRVEFTSILGTDVGGPSAAAPTTSARGTP